MAFSRTTSRVEVAREGLAVFRTPMSKGSPIVYGFGFLLGGTSQHLLRVWFLQGTGYEPECALEGQPVPCATVAMPPAQRRLWAERHLYATPRLRGPMGRGRRRRANAGDDPASEDDAIPVRPSFVSPRS